MKNFLDDAQRITLKALANFSPGRGPRAGSPRGVGAFALKPWVKKGHIYFVATLKELRRDCDSANGDATPSGLRLEKDSDAFFPGLPKRNPGLKLANAFSVIGGAQVPYLNGVRRTLWTRLRS